MDKRADEPNTATEVLLRKRCERLLEDSRLLEDYLVAGGLSYDDRLSSAILDLEQAMKGVDPIVGPIRECYEQLRKAFIESAKVAEPFITIEQLRAGKSPFNSENCKGLKNIIYKEVLVAVLTVGLILGSVAGFVVTNDISRRIADLERISLQGPLQKLADLRRLIDEGALDDPKRAIYTQYLKAAAEVATLFESAHSILLRTPQPEQYEPQVGVLHEMVRVIRWELAMTKSSGSGEIQISAPSPETCRSTAIVDEMYTSKTLKAAALEKLNDYCLAETLHLGSYSYREVAVRNAIRTLQQELSIIGVLVLPMLGGFLGATVFVIHVLMNDRLHPPMSTAYLLVRIIVGGSFGVIVGWFASTSSDSGELAQRISGTPFTLAFLAGFSIETLGSVLLTYSKTNARKKQV